MELASLTSYSSSFTLLVIAVITIALTKFFLLIYRQCTFWRKHGVPYFAPVPVLGSSWRVIFRRISFPDYCQIVYNRYPNARYVGVMDFATPTVVLRDPELIKEVAIKSFEHFTDHRAFVDEKIDPIFGKNVFSLQGERWKEMRNTLSPSFTASKMRFMFELVSKSSYDFVDYLYNHPEFSSSMETKDAFTRYTNDVIATAAFGISVNSMKDRDNEFYTKGKEATQFASLRRFIKFMLFRLSPRLTRVTGLSFMPREVTKFFHKVISETLKVRDEQGIVRPDMIHLLMQARDKDKPTTHEMTVDDIVAQAFIFFLAGFDTSSTLMTFLAYELAVNPDVQEKLRKEVDHYMAEGNGEITYETMSKMEYMEMVISEALRKYPPVIFLDRRCVEKFELPPAEPGLKCFTVQPDYTVWFPAYAMHHDPNYFPDPEKFDPERFSEENKDNISPYTYFPFGLGPRKCIGNRFVLMETKVLMARLVHRFILKPTEKTVIPPVFKKPSFALQSEGGLWIGLEKRKS